MELLRNVVSDLLAKLRGAPAADPVAHLAREANVSTVVAQLLLARGIRTGAEAATFFRLDESQLHDPFGMRGIEEAASLLLSAARAGRRIVVFGDYDVDGVTAVAQLKASLARVGAAPFSFIPDRLRDGYGFRPDTVRRVLSELAPSVIVTVDCGITAVDGVACAREAGVDVVVTDHHIVPDRLPSGAVVVNPRQPGCGYPYKELSGSGIAFKLSEAIVRRAGVSLSRDALLRAACLGTIADIVPLTGENRAIAALGLRALASPRAPGLAALLEACGIEPGTAPTSEEVAFRIAPRLNAAGRLDTAELALLLFEERDPTRARNVARELCDRNAERQAVERRVYEEARERIRGSFDPDRDFAIVEGDAAWHRGVLGIAASRLAREYNRPVLLFALDGEIASGSGRSIPGVPLHDTLKELRHRFTDFGGHDQAVGGSLSTNGFRSFREEARELFAARISPGQLERREVADADLPIDRVSPRLLDELERFEPHGAGNPRPVFGCRGARAAAPFRPVGEKGWRGRLETPDGDGSIDAICWEKRAQLGERSAAGETIDLDLHYRLSRSRWSGRPEIEIVNAWPASESTTFHPLPSPSARLPAPAAP